VPGQQTERERERHERNSEWKLNSARSDRCSFVFIFGRSIDRYKWEILIKIRYQWEIVSAREYEMLYRWREAPHAEAFDQP